MFYFRPFPTISYRIPGKNISIPVTDISKRFSVANFIQNARVTFDEYYVQDGERPDTVAYDYYGDYTLDWLILLVNEIHDNYFEWPLSYDQFQSYIKKKYGGLEYALSTVHHYEQIVQKHQIVVDGQDQRIIPEKTLVVDYQTYTTLIDSERKEVSIYEFEEKNNDNNRHIFLLDPMYLQVIKEQHPYVFGEGVYLR
jgi:hypothetical protein